MKARLGGLVLLGVALASASVAVGGDAKAELKKFQGEWAVERAREVGKDVPAEKAKKLTVLIAGDKLTLRGVEKEEDTATFTIDPTKKPRHIDITSKGATLPGIYAFEGGKLKLCFASDGGKRPTAFESPKGSDVMLLILKRVKK